MPEITGAQAVTPSSPKPERRKPKFQSRWNVFPARLCWDGQMVICNERLWIDVTDKVIT